MYVGMIQRGDCTGLTGEAFGELVFGDFDGDDAVQVRVAGLIDVAHAASTDSGEDLVGAESFAWAAAASG